MITILIADDDARKVHHVRRVIRDALLVADARVIEANNLYDAARILENEFVDLMVLDVQIPMRRGEVPRSDGGAEFLRQLKDGRVGGTPAYIVGLTAFPELAEAFRSEFSSEMWYVVEYDQTSEAWADALTRKLIHVAAIDSNRSAGFKRDMFILTALRAVELEAVLALDGAWREERVQGDDSIYYSGKFRRGRRSLSVVACAAPQMGMPAATATTMKVIEVFRPRYVAMAGIAAGMKGDMGDILVADQAWDYGSGKSRLLDDGTAVFEAAPYPIPLDEGLRVKLEALARDEGLLRTIRAEWRGDDPGTPLKAWLGPVASGSAVLENQIIMDQVRAQHRKAIGVEMETYGVFMAARLSRQPRPLVVSAKSVCDRGDATKSDAYQAYAAYTSARFLYAFAISHLLE